MMNESLMIEKTHILSEVPEIEDTVEQKYCPRCGKSKDRTCFYFLNKGSIVPDCTECEKREKARDEHF